MKNKNMKKLKIIPNFKNEAEEFEFWDKHEATDYFDFDNPVKLDLSKLKPSTEKMTLRMPKMLLDDLRIMANKRDVPYQSLIKMLLAEKVNEEMYAS